MTIRVGNTIIATVNKNTDGGSGGGLEVGDIGFAPLGIDETQNKRRYLNGQVISQSQFESFTSWVKERTSLYPSLVASEENWQAEVTNSPYGVCGKFVIDDTLGTIRLPKYPDWSIREVGEAPVVGNGMALGLTDGGGNYTIGSSKHNSDTTLNVSSSGYGQAVGQTATYATTGTLGVTTDPTKSGIIADLVNANTEDKLQGKWFIQVATGVEESVDVTREIELNNPFSLLDYKWSEYEITNASWLLSNGQFNSGVTYVSVYELLLKIYNGTETKDGVSVKLSTEDYEDTDFVINTADTTFRLPIKVKLASGNAVVGNDMTLGMTDGASNAGVTIVNNDEMRLEKNAYGTNIGTVSSQSYPASSNFTCYGVTTDPTKSGIETSSSGLKLYFYVGETIQDANVIAASQVLTKVANCIDRTVKSDRETVVNWGTPDYSAGISLSINTDNTITTSGFVYLYTNNTSGSLYINGVYMGEYTWHSGVYHNYNMVMLPVSKGDVVKATAATIFNFYPSQGVN